MNEGLAGSAFEGAVNPFGAPLFYKERTESTMQDAREVVRQFESAGKPVPNGAVAIAGVQGAGRGRLPGRVWCAPAGENLLCTVILADAPAEALTLRAGLAASKTFDSFLLPAGKGATCVKWPNDVLYNRRKLSGILCEADGAHAYVGAGLNINQKAFPPELAAKASSLALILDEKSGDASSGISLKAVLMRFLSFLKETFAAGYPWQEELSKRLFMLDERVRFLPASGGEGTVEGILRGVATDGALLLETDEGVSAFYSGEIIF